ncbi:MAG: PAS domain S-box protein [Desulfuromonadaceae bacterium]|nr:PAS domain S-box protein [Desulfuromonadaceae bacterium]
MFRCSLKTKVTLLFPLSVTIVLFALLFLIQHLLQGYIKESISNQQFQIVSNQADALDQKLAEAHNLLIVLAGKITPPVVSNPKSAFKFLLDREEFTWLFDNGIFLLDPRGRVIAELPLGLSRTGKDLSFRDYMKVTIVTKSSYISDPYNSSQSHHHPVIMLTAPILDASGNVVAVLGGSIDLLQPNFLGGLRQRKIGRTGYMFLFDRGRTMIVHPDQGRIMKRDIPPGANKLLDRAINGFEGTEETVNSRGLKTLATFKQLKSKGWIVGGSFPLSEAYLPVSRVRNLFMVFLPLLLVTMFWFMRRYLRRMTAPIIQLTSHVEGLPDRKGADRFFPLGGEDEVATLGQAFNELVQESDLQRSRLEADLGRHERADAQLQRQNDYLQALHETTLGLISRLDVADLLQTIVVRAGSLVGTEHCYVYLKNAAGTEMHMVFQSGIYNHLDHYPIKPGEGIAGRIWSSGKLSYIDDYSRWEGRLPDSGRDVLRCMAGVPLNSGEEVVGVLGVAFVDEGGLLNDEQLELLVQFGELASLALENARLNDESKRDLAERVKAEEHLRKLSVAVEQNPASIVITDTSGSIEYVNPHFTELTGYSFEEAVGQNSNILKTGGTSKEEYKQLWETILAGGEWRGEFHNRKKDGELYWEQALIAPIRDTSYAITHFIAIKEDITERKQLEGQLRQAQKMDAIGQLAGGIAHDFNNILAAIVGYASIMQLKLPIDSPLKRHAEQIAAAAERGSSLTKGLLAFSRKQASNPGVVDLNEIINRIHQLLFRLISEEIHLEINLEHEGLPVLADSGQIEQVLMNLATNARDAMPHGGSIVITTEAVTLDSDFILARGFGQPGRYALLNFTDSGDGMDADIVKHVFEPFYTTKEQGKGTGLGLSIIYGIIKEHKGYIVCHSTVGLGTIFQIYLPLLGSAPASSLEKLQEKAADTEGKSCILLAEDNETARLFGREILEEFGYVVLEAVDGEEALDTFREQRGRISLVILDVIMPKMNGREVYDAIRSVDPDMPMLFCSGYTKEVVVSQGGVEEGMNYLPKPFTPKELLMKIREVLDNEQ